MKKLWSYFRWILLGAGMFIVLAAVALGIYSSTEAFRRLVREQLIAAVNGSIRGTLSLERIEGSIWGDLTLHDVRLSYQQDDIVRIPRLKLTYALLPLLRGELQISRAEALEPAVYIVRDAQEHWNIAEALGSDDTGESEFSVLLKSLALRQGLIELHLMGQDPKQFRLQNVGMDGRLILDAKGIDFAASEITGRLQSQSLPELGLKGSLAYLDAGSAPALKVENLQVDSAASRLKLTGTISEFSKPNFVAKLAIEKLAAADLVRFMPQWPATQELAGTISANGRLDAMTLVVDLGAAAGRATANFTVDLAGAAPRYQGTFKLTGVDGRAWLAEQGVAGTLDGNADVTGVGLALDQLAGAASFTIRAAEVKGWRLGELRLQTKLQASSAYLTGDLKGALGGAVWRGTVTLSETPRYDFTVSLHNLDIKKVSAGGTAMDGVVNLKGTVKGIGTTLAQMKTQANLEILPSSVGPVKLRDGALVASLADGRIRISRGALRTADSSLALKGDLGVDFAQQGKLDYEFRTNDVGPWLALAGHKGSGSLTLTGSAQGNLTDLKTRGAVKLAKLTYDKLALQSGAVDYDLTRTTKQDLPNATLVARLTGMRAGIELSKLDGMVRLAAQERIAHVEVKAQDRLEQIHTLQASIDFSQADIVTRLSALSLNLPDGLWQLTAPATLTQRADSWSVERLTLRNRESEASLAGTLTTAGRQSLNLTIKKFPLEALAALLPRQPTMSGLLALQANIGGDAAAPEISATVSLTDSKIGGQIYAGLAADLSYRERQASLNLTVRQDAAHSLTAIGKMPLLLNWHEGWRSEITGDMDVRVKSAALSLAFLNAYTAKTIRDLGGEISIDLIARGRPAAPSLSGSFQLNDGKLKSLPLNVQIDSIAAAGSFDSRMIRIHNLAARANNGTFSGSGLLTLKNYQLDGFKISLAARRWPAIDTRRYRAKIGGDVAVEGSLGAPKITGTLEIVEADLRPDLAFLERSSTAVKRDETITVIYRAGSQRATPAKNDSNNNGISESELFKKLSLDLTLKMPGNIRIRHPDASAELRGNLRASKKAGQDPQLTGYSEIVRGWAAFQGRRFEIARGEIRFIGGDTIDPTLDILAQYRLPQYTVNAQVGGTAENPSLALSSNPSLDQADILALLLFGKPSRDLNRNEQNSLQQNALDITTGFAAATIGSAIAEAIGLDSLGFGDIGISGDRVGLGRYIGRRTYVTVNQELAGERGQEASIEYQLAPDWKVGSTTTSKGSSDVEVIWHKRY